MTLLFWNVRWLGDPTKRRMVRDSIYKIKAEFVSLEEFKLSCPMLTILHKLGGL